MDLNISFIVPVYNTSIEKFKRCILSIESFDIKDYEIIIINDGSEKIKSIEYEKFIDDRKNIIYIKNTNKGVSYSRNNGIEKASKDYIMFVDSDDYVITEYMTKSKLNIKDDIIIFDIINVTNTIISNYKFNKGQVKLNDFVNAYIVQGIISTPCAKLFKTSFIINNNLRFNTEYVQGEDAYFNLECLNCNPTIYYYNIPIYTYDYNAESTIKRWKNSFDSALEGKYAIFFKKIELIEKLNFKNKAELLKKNEKQFVRALFHSYLILLKLSDKAKIKKYIKEFRKHRINTKNLDSREKVYYFIMKHNQLLVRLVLKFILVFKKI